MSITKIAWLIIIILISVILTVIYFSPEYYVWDEKFYLPLAFDVAENGINIENSVFYVGSAPGPAYQIIFGLIIKTLPFLKTYKFFRFSNALMFLASIVIFNNFKNENNKLLYGFIFLLSVPFNYSLIMIGLNDTLSIFFLSISYYFLEFKERTTKWYLIAFIFFILAVGTRQYMILYGIVFAKELYQNFISGKRKYFWIKTLISIVLSLPLMWLFYQWKGIVPPDQAFAGNGVSVGNLIYAIVYYIIILSILKISFLIDKLLVTIKQINSSNIKSIILLAIIFCLFMFFINPLNGKKPLKLLTIMFNVDFNYILYGFYLIFSTALALFTFSLRSKNKILFADFYKIIKAKNNYNIKKLFLIFYSLLPLKITHQYTSKYTAIITPFIFIILNKGSDNSYLKIKLFILIFGFILGLFSVFGLYNIPQYQQ